MYEEILENLGLTKREAKAYLVLLNLGSSTTGPIVQKSEIPSSKIYEVLERLMQKGLVSYTIISHQKHFQASNPETLLDQFNEKKQKFEEILPQLKERQKHAENKKSVELFTGKQAVFKLLRNLVDNAKKGDEYLSFSLGLEHERKDLSDFLSNLAQRRVEKELKIKVLSKTSNKKIIQEKYSKKDLRIINNKFTNFDFPQGMIILNDNLVIVDFEDNPTAILIKSKSISEKYRKFFYSIYNKIKKIK